MRGMTLIVKNITKLMVPSIFLLGVYVVLHGHLTPGGGFAGGILIAGSFVLVILAYGSDETKNALRKWHGTLFESLGIFLFWAMAFIGLIFFSTFFYNFIHQLMPGEPGTLFSAGIIPVCNLAIGVEVAAALFSVFIVLAVLRVGGKL